MGTGGNQLFIAMAHGQIFSGTAGYGLDFKIPDETGTEIAIGEQ